MRSRPAARPLFRTVGDRRIPRYSANERSDIFEEPHQGEPRETTTGTTIGAEEVIE